jgi:hypothetical protein
MTTIPEPRPGSSALDTPETTTVPSLPPPPPSYRPFAAPATSRSLIEDGVDEATAPSQPEEIPVADELPPPPPPAVSWGPRPKANAEVLPQRSKMPVGFKPRVVLGAVAVGVAGGALVLHFMG